MGTPELRWPLTKEQNGPATRVRFQGRQVSLDERDTELVRQELFRLADERDGGDSFQIDMANVTFLTSSTLGVLLLLYKKLRSLNRQLVLLNVMPHIYEIFAITSLNRLFEVRPVAAASGQKV